MRCKPGFHYTANATTTTQKQSDYKVEQSSFTLIALFRLEIGRCRGRNWLNGNQAKRRISCHGRNCSQPYFFKRNQSSDNRSHGFGAKFLLKKLSASDFSYERKSAFNAEKCSFTIGCLLSRENLNSTFSASYV